MIGGLKIGVLFCGLHLQLSHGRSMRGQPLFYERFGYRKTLRIGVLRIQWIGK